MDILLGTASSNLQLTAGTAKNITVPNDNFNSLLTNSMNPQKITLPVVGKIALEMRTKIKTAEAAVAPTDTGHLSLLAMLTQIHAYQAGETSTHMQMTLPAPSIQTPSQPVIEAKQSTSNASAVSATKKDNSLTIDKSAPETPIKAKIAVSDLAPNDAIQQNMLATLMSIHMLPVGGVSTGVKVALPARPLQASIQLANEAQQNADSPPTAKTPINVEIAQTGVVKTDANQQSRLSMLKPSQAFPNYVSEGVPMASQASPIQESMQPLIQIQQSVAHAPAAATTDADQQSMQALLTQIHASQAEISKNTQPVLPVAVPTAIQPTNETQQSAVNASSVNTPFGTSGWTKDVVQQVVVMAKDNLQTISLDLNPPHLGPLQVVLKIENQVANVQFSSAAPEVQQVLRDGIPILQGLLAQAGIQLGQTDIGGRQPNRGHQYPSEKPNGSALSRENEAVQPINPASQIDLPYRAGLVNLYA